MKVNVIAVTNSNQCNLTGELSYIIQDIDNKEKIPVYIWYKDINQEEVSLLTNQITGLTPDNCEIIDEFLAPDILNELKRGNTEAEQKNERVS